MNVGGLPTFAWWSNLIIMFELTMLGAIVATVITLVVTAGFGRGQGRLCDPGVSDGKIPSAPHAQQLPPMQLRKS